MFVFGVSEGGRERSIFVVFNRMRAVMPEKFSVSVFLHLFFQGKILSGLVFT